MRTILTELYVTPETLQLFLLLWSPEKFMVGQAMKIETTMAVHHRDTLSEHWQHPRGTQSVPPQAPSHTPQQQ